MVWYGVWYGIHCVLCFSVGRSSNDCGVVWYGIVWYGMVWCGMVFIVYYVSQLVDLLMTSDWSTYMADHGKSYSKYSRVNPSVAAKLLEK